MRTTEKWFKESMIDAMVVIYSDCMDDVGIENCVDDIAENLNFNCTPLEFVKKHNGIYEVNKAIRKILPGYLPTEKLDDVKLLNFYTELLTNWGR